MAVYYSLTGPVSNSSQASAFYPNRIAVNSGAITLSFTAGHAGDDMNNFTTPTAVWLKHGYLVGFTTPTNMAVGGNGGLSSTLLLPGV